MIWVAWKVIQAYIFFIIIISRAQIDFPIGLSERPHAKDIYLILAFS